MVDTGLFANITSTKPIDFDGALAGLLLQDLDDGHSGVNQFSWRCGQDNSLIDKSKFIKAALASESYS